MATTSPARLYCTLAGAALVIVGVIGFFYSAGFDTGTRPVNRDTEEIFGVLATNGWHNLLRIALGALALIAAGSMARTYALAAGLLFVVLALWGWIDSDDILLDLLPLNGADKVVYLLLGLTGMAAGAATAKPVTDRKPRAKRGGEEPKPGRRARPEPVEPEEDEQPRRKPRTGARSRPRPSDR